MTEYVATRWYRAPEIMLSFQNYTKAIDIWSVGCIFAEMLGSKVLFPGRDYVHQLNLILNILGTPSEETISRIGSPRAQDYVRNLPRMPKVPFKKLFPSASDNAIDLLEKLLDFDPTKRITVEEALVHPYLATYHDPADEPTQTNFDFTFEQYNRIDDLRKLILDEINTYYNPRLSRMRRPSAQIVLTDKDSFKKGNSYEVNEPYVDSSGNMEVDKELEKDLSGMIDPQETPARYAQNGNAAQQMGNNV